MTNPRIYRFGPYRLDTAARELRRNGELLPLPRRVFDGLAHLVEQRERAVSHDELIATLWGRTEVANAQVSQLIMQVRRAVADDSTAQQAVRTVPGFGYRWVAATEELPLPTGADVRAGDAAEIAAGTPAPGTAVVAATVRVHRWRGAALAALVALLLVAVLFHFGARMRPQATPPHGAGQSIVVLPIEVDAPEDSDAAWVRLGVMDLIAGRLREAGLPVPPSDSVVAALHATAALPEAQRLDELERTLGAGILVQGVATRSESGWTIELTTLGSDDGGRRVESSQRDIMDTAQQAADLLLAAFGQALPADTGVHADLGDRLQRARAAMLAGELDTARAILADAPAGMRADPELRCELAWIEFHSGRVDQAMALTGALLADPAVMAQPRLHARALRMRGWITIMGEDEDWAAAEHYFDTALQTWPDDRPSAERGKLLAERGVARVMLRRFDEAVLDLGQARSQLEIAGDRKALGEMNNYLGQLEFMRERVAEAVPYFSVAADISESFGAIDSLRYNLMALLGAQMRLLSWPDARATSERLWTLRGRIDNPGLRASIDGYHANVLLALGHQREAALVLDGIGHTGIPPSMARFGQQARAALAWQRGQPAQAFVAATAALENWPDSSPTDTDQRAGVTLLRQRASIAAGQPDAAAIAPGPGSIEVYRLVAAAEWADHRDAQEQAALLFRDAAAAAEALGVPDVVALVAQARGYWLLEHGEIAQANAQAGRIAVWATQDFDSALLQVAAFHAGAQAEAWARALRRAESLAGERVIPAAWRSAPTAR